MILADFLPPKRDRSWDFARQVGVTHAIARCHPRDTGLNPPWEIDALRTVQRNFAASGIKLIGLEGDEFDMRRIKLGLAGRDEDLELYCCLLANMGELGIRLLCYNFMATIGRRRRNPTPESSNHPLYRPPPRRCCQLFC